MKNIKYNSEANHVPKMNKSEVRKNKKKESYESRFGVKLLYYQQVTRVMKFGMRIERSAYNPKCTIIYKSK